MAQTELSNPDSAQAARARVERSVERSRKQRAMGLTNVYDRSGGYGAAARARLMATRGALQGYDAPSSTLQKNAKEKRQSQPSEANTSEGTSEIASGGSNGTTAGSSRGLLPPPVNARDVGEVAIAASNLREFQKEARARARLAKQHREAKRWLRARAVQSKLHLSRQRAERFWLMRVASRVEEACEGYDEVTRKRRVAAATRLQIFAVMHCLDMEKVFGAPQNGTNEIIAKEMRSKQDAAAAEFVLAERAEDLIQIGAAAALERHKTAARSADVDSSGGEADGQHEHLPTNDVYQKDDTHSAPTVNTTDRGGSGATAAGAFLSLKLASSTANSVPEGGGNQCDGKDDRTQDKPEPGSQPSVQADARVTLEADGQPIQSLQSRAIPEADGQPATSVEHAADKKLDKGTEPADQSKHDQPPEAMDNQELVYESNEIIHPPPTRSRQRSSVLSNASSGAARSSLIDRQLHANDQRPLLEMTKTARLGCFSSPPHR